MQCTSREIAVVIDKCSPAWHDVESCITIVLNVGSQWPESVLLIAKDWTRIVSYHVDDPVVHPSLDGICVVQTSDSRRDDTLSAPALSSIKADLFQPGLVERDLFRCIGVRRVGQVGVRTGFESVVQRLDIQKAYNVCEMCAKASRCSSSANQFSSSSISAHSRLHVYWEGVAGQMLVPVPGGFVYSGLPSG